MEDSTISKTISINKAGAQQIIAQASFTNGSVHRDTIQFFLAGNASIVCIACGNH